MSRLVRAARGPTRTAKGWIQDAANRMLMNNADAEVASGLTTLWSAAVVGAGLVDPRVDARRVIAGSRRARGGAARPIRGVRRLLSVVPFAAVLVAGGALGAQPATQRDPLIGRLVPTFAWPSLEDSLQLISPLSLQGSVVLVDLWATWCAPCRREMPFLHEAYARFQNQGFEIVSVSFDVSPGRVEAFRRGPFPMPWQHVYATGPIETDATRLFRVDSFPRTLLIDRDGTVLRTDSGLRGQALAATLDSLFRGTLPRR